MEIQKLEVFHIAQSSGDGVENSFTRAFSTCLQPILHIFFIIQFILSDFHSPQMPYLKIKSCSTPFLSATNSLATSIKKKMGHRKRARHHNCPITTHDTVQTVNTSTKQWKKSLFKLVKHSDRESWTQIDT